jgi:hypothetical protein
MNTLALIVILLIFLVEGLKIRLEVALLLGLIVWAIMRFL